MEAVLDSPVMLHPVGHDAWLCLGHRLGADQVGHFHAALAFAGGGTTDLQHLPDSGEVDPGRRLGGFDGAGDLAAMTDFGGSTAHRYLGPGQGRDLLVQGGLILLSIRGGRGHRLLRFGAAVIEVGGR